MNSQSMAVIVEPEREQEMVMVSVRHIEKDHLFWPDEGATFHLLASTWEIVDPMEDDADSISKLMVDSKRGEMVHVAQQELVQLCFVAQPGGILMTSEFFIGTPALFQEDLPTIIGLMQKWAGSKKEYVLILLYEVDFAEESQTLHKELCGYLFSDALPFAPIMELPQQICLK